MEKFVKKAESEAQEEGRQFADAIETPLKRQLVHRDSAVAKDEEITHNHPNNLDLLSVIGQGAFGKVILVRHKFTEKLFAMKVMSKQHLKKKNYVEYVQAERDIMTKVRHPFLVQLHYAFQTSTKVYLVMTYLAGGELFFLLQKQGLFLEDVARFYLAEIVLAVKHLHSLGIVHRDLKPENVLVGADGHICLTDFGLSKVLNDDSSTTRTICGTNEYMAPEMLRGTGYNEGVDWWAVGCLFYEMLCGEPPFKAKSAKKLKDQILQSKPKLPPWASGAAHSLVKGLLDRNVERRLGSGKSTMFRVKGVQAIMDHAFFKSIDWNLLEQKKVTPPIIPKLEHEMDTTNFHAKFTEMRVSVLSTRTSSSIVDNSGPDNNTFRDFSFVNGNLVEGAS